MNAGPFAETRADRGPQAMVPGSTELIHRPAHLFKCGEKSAAVAHFI